MLKHDIYEGGFEDWVVFLHGIGGKNTTFQNQIADFSKEYNLILIELPWHNASPFKYEDLTPQTISDEIKEVLDYNDIESAHFVALSLGTIVLSHFSTIYPEYIKSMVLTSSVIEVSLLLRCLVTLVFPFKWILPYKLVYNLCVFAVAPQKQYKDARKMFIEEFDKIPRRKIISWVDYMKHVMYPKRTIEKMHKLFNNKIYFISGSNDKIFLNGSKITAQKLANGKIDILDKCCHICNLDGYELYNKKVLSFLKKYKTDNLSKIRIDIKKKLWYNYPK